jgi:hypothetical protein
MFLETREKAEKLAIEFLTRKMNPKQIGVDGVVFDNATGLWHVKGRMEDSKGVTRKFLVRVIWDREVYDWTTDDL